MALRCITHHSSSSRILFHNSTRQLSSFVPYKARSTAVQRSDLAKLGSSSRYFGRFCGSTRSRHPAFFSTACASVTSVTPGMKQVRFFPERYPEICAETSSDAFTEPSDLLALVVSEDLFQSAGSKDDSEPPKLGSVLEELDSKLSGILTALTSNGAISGKKDSSASTHWIGGRAKMVGVFGVGEKKKLIASEDRAKIFKGVGKQIATCAKSNKSSSARVCIVGLEEEEDLESLAAGILLGGYEATRFKASAKVSPLATVYIHTPAEKAKAQLSAGVAYAKGTLLARYLVEAPPNICTPTHIAEAAMEVQKAAPDVFQLEILEKEQCAEMNMGLYLGVSECSEEPPKFIHLTYRSPGEGNRKVIGLVGKGLTFDSGGYNLKVGGMIDLMKFDMGGAGAILGAAHTIGMLQPPNLEIHFISASCENMISGRGMRPGDILTAANGMTVEINNTDAEGRLTLGDALWYAQEKCKVTKVVDIATLTGACMVALGTEVAGLLSPSKAISNDLVEASEAAGERLWPLPMQSSYWSQMKSPIADMKNSGGRMGGAITAGLFLEQYVDTEKVEWAHIDIAGPAWDEKQNQATGFGSAVLAKWLMHEGK